MSETKDALGRAVSRRGFLATSALAGASVVGSGALLSACGGGSGGSTPGGSTTGGAFGDTRSGTVSWESWANPGEAERFKAYSKDYTSKYKTAVNYQVVAGTYQAKLLTQLAGGAASDCFYAGDGDMTKLIESNNVAALDDYLANDQAPVHKDTFFKGLTPFTRGADGKTYGMPVDCNPVVLWYNKGILSAAGITDDPASMQEAGTWTRDTYTDMLTKIKATGVNPATIENGWWGFWFGYLTSTGGKLFSDEGEYVGDSDAEVQASAEWLVQNLQDGNIVYGGALPKGQGVDALFYAKQLGFLNYGRWVLPNLKKLNGLFEFDITVFPSKDGKSIPSTPIGVAAMAVNAKAKDTDNAFHFAGHYVAKDGQQFRLSGGGNAVPSISGLETIVTEGNLPAHASWFNDLAAAGYSTPKPLYSSATRSSKLGTWTDSQFLPDPLKSLTGKTLLTNLGTFLKS